MAIRTWTARKHIGASACAIAVGLIGCPATAHAQEPVAEIEAPSAVAGEGQDIVVTARKREERLRDVPVAVTALSGEALAQSNVVRLTDLVTLEPTFTVSVAANGPSTTLRGLGTYGPTFEQSVGKFVDNVSLGRDFHIRVPIYDVERVEVLKGPQVLLFGNSTTAGALNITTKKPGSAFAADFSASYEFEHREAIVQGGVTVPLTDTLSARVGGFYQNLSRGWMINDFNSRSQPTFDNFGIRPSLRFRPSADLTVDLKVEIDRVRDKGGTAQPVTQGVNPRRQVPDAVKDNHRTAPYSAAPFFAEEYQSVDHNLYQFDVRYDTGSGTISSTTAIMDSRYGGNAPGASGNPDFLASSYSTYSQVSQELRFDTKAGPVDIGMGLYFERYHWRSLVDRQFNFPFYGIPFPAVGVVNETSQVTKNYSGFADLRWNISDRFSVSAGARYSIIRRKVDQSAAAANIIPGLNFNTPWSAIRAQINPALNAAMLGGVGQNAHSFTGIDVPEEHFQPQLLAQYRPNSDVMLYLKFVRGAKSGGYDFTYGGTNRDAGRFQPEFGRSFEAGIKGVAADGRIDYAVNAFTTTFSDLQVFSTVGSALFITNVGKARSQGVEFDVGVRPLAGLRINGTFTFLDAKYLTFRNGVCTVAQTLATPAGQVCTQDLSGAPTPFQSKYSGTFNISYMHRVGDLEITGGATVLARSKFNTTTGSNDPLADQAHYESVDLNLEVAQAGGPLSLSFFVRNLLDDRYNEYAGPTALVPGAFNLYLSRGRQLGLRLSGSF